jgi:hypothetical protein
LATTAAATGDKKGNKRTIGSCVREDKGAAATPSAASPAVVCARTANHNLKLLTSRQRKNTANLRTRATRIWTTLSRRPALSPITLNSVIAAALNGYELRESSVRILCHARFSISR